MPPANAADSLLSGRLVDSTGGPLSNHYLLAKDTNYGQAGGTGITGADGSFTITSTPGTRFLQIGSTSGPSWYLFTNPFSVSGDRALGDLTVPALRTITVRVLDEGGSPVPGANIVGGQIANASNGWTAAGTSLASGITAAEAFYPVPSNLVTDENGRATFAYPSFNGTGVRDGVEANYRLNGTLFTVTLDHATATGPNSYDLTLSRLSLPRVPGPPRLVTATRGANSGSVDVSWQSPIETGGSPVAGYTVTSSPGAKTCTTTGALTCTVTGLTNGTAYTFTVKATNAVGDGAASAASNAITPAAVPAAPTGATATRGDKSAQVSWAAPASDGGSTITGYTVTSSPGAKTCTTTGALTCTVTGLTNGTPVATATFARAGSRGLVREG